MGAALGTIPSVPGAGGIPGAAPYPMKRGLNDLRVRECKCPIHMGPHNPDEKGVEGLVDLERLKASIMNGSSSGGNPLSSRGCSLFFMNSGITIVITDIKKERGI
jgi:hypothetical protein